MREITVEELQKGDLILVRWLDASDIRCTLEEHEGRPDIHVKDWGLFLGVSGIKRRLLIIGKDVVEVQNDWGATRIPLDLIDEILLIIGRDQMIRAVPEVQALTRRVKLRKYRREAIYHI